MRVQTIVAPAPLQTVSSPHWRRPTARGKGCAWSVHQSVATSVTEPTPALHYDISIEYDRMAAAVATAGDATNPSDTALELRVEVSAPSLAQLGSRRAESLRTGRRRRHAGLFLHNLNAESAEV